MSIARNCSKIDILLVLHGADGAGAGAGAGAAGAGAGTGAGAL